MTTAGFEPVMEAVHTLTQGVADGSVRTSHFSLPSVANIETVGGFDATDNNISINKTENFFVDADLGDDTITITESAETLTILGNGGEDFITFNGDVDDALVKGGPKMMI